MKRLPPLIVVAGPTGSGKSALAIRLAKKFSAFGGGEIINADSRSIYRGLEIGTAVPTPIQQRSRDSSRRPWIISGVPHWLVAYRDPKKIFTVAQYQRDAFRVIADIHRRDRIPFLVGGSGLYLRAVVENIAYPHVAPQSAIRKKLGRLPLAVLWRRLIKLDPAAAAIVQKENPRRVIRALEVCLATGQRWSELQRKDPPRYRALMVGVKADQAALYARLDRRVRAQIRAGLVSETRRALKKYGRRAPPLAGFVYREVLEHLDHKYDAAEMIRRIQFANHAYARRQLTWLRHQTKPDYWIKNKTAVEPIFKKFLQNKK